MENLKTHDVYEWINLGPTTFFGCGALEKKFDGIVKYCVTKKEMNRFLIVGTPTAYKVSGAWDTVKYVLEKYGVEYAIYDKVRPNPTYQNCDEAAEMGFDNNSQVILTIGGGSSIDTAKTAAALLCYHRLKAKDLYETKNPSELMYDKLLRTGKVKHAKKYEYALEFKIEKSRPLIVITTTHGTSSEINPFAVAQEDGRYKPAIMGRLVLPEVTIIDPLLTKTLPLEQTIATSLDAFSRALESSTTIVSNNFSNLLATKVANLVTTYLPIALVEPNNEVARYYLHYVSNLIGFNFTDSVIHYPHVVEHAMVAINPEVIHGIGLGILTPYTLKQYYHSCPKQLSRMLKPIIPELEGKPGEGDLVYKKMKDWLYKIGFSKTLKDYGFSEKDIPDLIEKTRNAPVMSDCVQLSPIRVTDKVLKDLLLHCLAE
jgi:alcohol dehydrogenase class IV